VCEGPEVLKCTAEFRRWTEAPGAQRQRAVSQETSAPWVTQWSNSLIIYENLRLWSSHPFKIEILFIEKQP
jgi:hypothetical protein